MIGLLHVEAGCQCCYHVHSHYHSQVLCHVLKYPWKNSCQLYRTIVTFPSTGNHCTNSFTHFQLYIAKQKIERFMHKMTCNETENMEPVFSL